MLKLGNLLRCCVGAVVIAGALAASPVAAQAPPAAPPVKGAVLDVVLRDGGVLVGQVVDRTGMPQPAAPVHVLHAGRTVASVTTDAHGRFAVAGLRLGLHSLASVSGAADCRLWPTVSAPANATPGVLLIQEGAEQHPGAP